MASLFTGLDMEWSRIADDRAVADELADVCSIAGVRSLAELVPLVRSADRDLADGVLAALARRSAAGSRPAARVLLQLLLPGTCRLAARWWALGDADERAAAAVAAVYDRICRYPIDRRPRHIAANVLLDAGQDLWRAARRVTRDAQHVVPVEPHTLPSASHEREPSAAEELCEVLAAAVAAGVVRVDDAELIVATRIRGEHFPTLACERGAKLRTLQWRRQRAERALAAAGAAA